MASISRKARIASMATAAAGLAIGLVTAFAPSASAAVAPVPAGPTPVVTVTPSAGLPNGITVIVTATGFAPNVVLETGECANLPSGLVACPAGPFTVFTTDPAGAGKTPLTVVNQFKGFLSNGAPVGIVDCHVVQCIVGVSDVNNNGGEVPLNFL